MGGAADDFVYQIRTHLLYELKWMVYAAARFAEDRSGDPEVALLDSATVHARNLFEFAAKNDRTRFTLGALGGRVARDEAWAHWTNNRVTHMLDREGSKAPWPYGLDNSRRDRLMKMAGSALDRLESGGQAIPTGAVREAYDEVVGAARTYWRRPTSENHDALSRLYDGGRDGTAPSY